MRVVQLTVMRFTTVECSKALFVLWSRWAFGGVRHTASFPTSSVTSASRFYWFGQLRGAKSRSIIRFKRPEWRNVLNTSVSFDRKVGATIDERS